MTEELDTSQMEDYDTDDAEEIDIRPDRLLLNPNFDKYILSSQILPVIRSNFGQKLRTFEPSVEQWSRQEGKLFSMSQPIFVDLFASVNNQMHLYYFTVDGKLKKSVFTGERQGSFGEEVEVVLDPLPGFSPSVFTPDRYPLVIKFVDTHHAIVSDGVGFVAIYHTDVDRIEWKNISTFALTAESNSIECVDPNTVGPNNGKYKSFTLADVHHGTWGNIEVALLSVSKRKEEGVEGKPVFISDIYWLSFKQECAELKLSRSRRFESEGNLEAVTFAENGTNLVVLSARKPEILYDSTRQIKSRAEREAAKPPARYFWSQTETDITIRFERHALIAKGDIKVDFAPSHLTVTCQDSALLDGDLFAAIQPDLCTWTIQHGTGDTYQSIIEVTLSKSRVSYMRWPKLIPADKGGKEVAADDAGPIEAVAEHNAHVNINPDQLEEVDEDDDSGILFLSWVDCESGNVIRNANLSFHKILFTQQLTANSPTGICMREDVDGVFYSFADPAKAIVHDFTLDAFGYIQAGKSSRKFSLCAPDGGFSAVVDGRNHAYIYLKCSAIGDGARLRNNKTGKQVATVARQFVVSLSSSDEDYRNGQLGDQCIVSAFADNNHLFLATDWAIFAYTLVD